MNAWSKGTGGIRSHGCVASARHQGLVGEDRSTFREGHDARRRRSRRRGAGDGGGKSNRLLVSCGVGGRGENKGRLRCRNTHINDGACCGGKRCGAGVACGEAVDARREFGEAERRGAGCVCIDGRERNIILKKGDGSGDGAAGRAQNRGQDNRVRPDLIVSRGGK